MADRHTLHFKHLEPFKNWLIKNNWEMKPLSKSQYEVLRATKNGKWVIIYLKDSATEHYSLTENSIYVVNQWLKERKIRKEVVEEIYKKCEPLFRLVNNYDNGDVIERNELVEILDQIRGE